MIAAASWSYEPHHGSGPTSLGERLRALVEPALDGDRIVVDARDPGARPRTVSLAKLPELMRWEIGYGILRSREVPRAPSPQLNTLRSLVAALSELEVTSLLELDENAWPSFRRPPRPGTGRLTSPFLRFTIDEVETLAGTNSPEHEYARDVWRLRRIGIPAHSSIVMLDFTPIEQPWLRAAAKRFLRWRRASEHSPSGMHRDWITLVRLASALSDVAGPGAGPERCTREVIERFQTVLLEAGLTPNGRRMALSSARRFLAVTRQLEWVEGLPGGANIYIDDVPAITALPPKALSEQVMTQLEDPANLDRLTDPRWRLLFPLLMQTGLRLGDATALPVDCVVHDADGAPYLRYVNHKMRREALVPIAVELAEAIAAHGTQMRAVHTEHAVLFPRDRANPDGRDPVPKISAQLALKEWIAACDIRDHTGALARVTAHQFRHTLGTRLINKDVPQEIVRRILDHTSTQMTAHYARLHDTTVRDHWERARKVDVHGQPVHLETDSPLADAGWTRRHLDKASVTLPNGYCGLPAQRACPHANACLTCAVFITTPEFLPQHRTQLQLTQAVVERACAAGQTRLAEVNQTVAANLTSIISALEAGDDPS